MFGFTTFQAVGIVALILVHTALGFMLWRFTRRLLNDEPPADPGVGES